MKTRNRIGPKTELWGTPELTRTDPDSSPSITTVCDLLPRKAWIQDSAFPLIPYWWSLHMSFEWFTLSKAFEKSSSIRSVCLPTLVFLARSSNNMVSWVSHDLFSLKQCWRSYNRSCLSNALPDVMPLYVQGLCREYRWGRSVCNLQPMFYHLFWRWGWLGLDTWAICEKSWWKVKEKISLARKKIHIQISNAKLMEKVLLNLLAIKKPILANR